jgi:outer membrane protein assembly factor BamB
MVLCAALACSFAGMACTKPADWLVFRGGQGQGFTPGTVGLPLAVKWKLRLQDEGSPVNTFNSPVVLDRTMYFGSADGNFYAFDIDTGFMRWIFKTARPINSVPLAVGKAVYFGSNDGKVYALTRDEGLRLWDFDTRHTVQSALTSYKDLVVFSSDAGFIHFLDLQGNQVDSLVNPVWGTLTFQIHDDVMYFAPGPPSYPTSLGAFDMKRHEYLWTIDTAHDSTIWYSFPAIKDGLLFYGTCSESGGSWNLAYHALDRETGSVIWSMVDDSRFGGEVPAFLDALFDENLGILDYLAPSVWKDLVIYTSGDSLVRAFDADSGSLRWTRELEYPTSSAPIVAGNRVYLGVHGDEVHPARKPASTDAGGSVGSGGGSAGFRNPSLVCLSASSGTVLWRMETEGAIMSAPVIAGNWLVFGTSLHYLYVLEQVF